MKIETQLDQQSDLCFNGFFGCLFLNFFLSSQGLTGLVKIC